MRQGWQRMQAFDCLGAAELHGELRHSGPEVCCCHPALVSLLVHLQGVPHALRAQALVTLASIDRTAQLCRMS